MQSEQTQGFWGTCSWVLVTGLIVRFIFAPFTSWVDDVNVWFQVASQGWNNHGPYSAPGFSYPPVWSYWLSLLGRVDRLLGLPVTSMAHHSAAFATLGSQIAIFSGNITTPGFNLAFKTILIASDLAVAGLIWHISQHLGVTKRQSRLAVGLWFLSPAVILTTSIHGQFDTLIALEVIGAIALWMHHSHFGLGAVLVAGVLTKVIPGFLIPVFAVAVLFPPSTKKLDWRGLARLVAGGIGAFIIIMLPIAASGELKPLILNVFTRANTSEFGGLSWLGGKYLPHLTWLTLWFDNPGNHVGRVLEFLQFSAALGAAIIWVRIRRKAGVEQLTALVAMILLIIILLGPLSQPQYLLWMLPLLALATVWNRRSIYLVIGWSVVALIFYQLLSPLAFLAPLATFTNAIAPHTVIQAIHDVLLDPGFVVPTLSSTFTSVSWLLAMLLMIGSIRFFVMEMRVRSRPAMESISYDADGAVGPHSRRARISVIAGLACVVLIEGLSIMPVTGSTPSNLSISVATVHNGMATINVTADTGPFSLHAVAVPVVSHPFIPKFFIYEDPAYPDSSSLATIQGVANHLVAHFRLYGIQTQVNPLTADALRNFLERTDLAPGRLLIAVAGVLPSAVWSVKTDLITPWVKAGGTIVWAGDIPGYYSVGPAPSLTVTPPSQVNNNVQGCLYTEAELSLAARSFKTVRFSKGVEILGLAGVERFLGMVPQGGPGYWPLNSSCVATTPSSVATALGLQYINDRSGIPLPEIAQFHGELLGYVAVDQASISLIPFGVGQELIFGGVASGSASAIATDLTRIIVSGEMTASGQTHSAVLHGNASVTLTVPISGESQGVELTILDSSPYGSYLHGVFLPIDLGRCPASC